MTTGFSSSDMSRSVVDAINLYYQEVLISKRFKKNVINGTTKFEPCSLEEGVTIHNNLRVPKLKQFKGNAIYFSPLLFYLPIET